jgi:hypothetical protein
MEEHEKRVGVISECVKSFQATSTPFRIYHGATNSTRVISKDSSTVVDTSPLRHVVSVDSANLTAIVEANVAMDELVDVLLPKGLIPKIVPEFPGITVGGAYSGTAAESSSFKEGYFDRIVNWVEIVLADGRVVKTSPAENEDLFYGAAGALGTLGVVTLLEMQLVEVEEYVEVTYTPTTSITDALAKLKEIAKDTHAIFLDALLFTLDQGVIIQGKLSASKPSKSKPLARFTRKCDPWFFLHAHTKLPPHTPDTCRTCRLLSPSQREPSITLTELVPVKDYLFRYDRGAFWMGSYGWDALPVPFNKFGRALLDPLFKTRKMYAIMHHSGQSQRFVVQDLALPPESAEAFLSFVTGELRIWPLWICPIRGGSRVPMHNAVNHASTGADEMLINVGVWGLPLSSRNRPVYYGRSTFASFILLNRMIEAKVRDLGGLKWLYAHNYTTEDEFWASYDRQKYDEMRKKWGAEKMVGVWDKVGGATEWESRSILKGFWRGAVGGEYLLRRNTAKTVKG